MGHSRLSDPPPTCKQCATFSGYHHGRAVGLDNRGHCCSFRFGESPSSLEVSGQWLIRHAQAYASSLAALLLNVPTAKSSTVSFHATLATLGVLGAYAYRDVWPLVAFGLSPADAHEGWLIWTKISLAGIAGILVPMAEPHIYIPFDPLVRTRDLSPPSWPTNCPEQRPQAYSNPEQTTSLLGFITWSFVSPLIAKSQRVPHLAFDMLPPMLDTDEMHALRPRSTLYLDPLAVSSRCVSVYRALLVMFAGSWVRQTVLLILSALATLGSPVGTNRLLRYIEHGGEGAVVRPWVWIALIALAPLVQCGPSSCPLTTSRAPPLRSMP
jgi:hypothetical protein